MSQFVNALAQKMQEYEVGSNDRISDGVPFCVRCDGISFSSLTRKNFRKPRDPLFDGMMLKSAVATMTRFRPMFALSQSDEVSFFFASDFSLYNRRIEKILTAIATQVATVFSLEMRQSCLFDARICVLPDPDVTSDYVTWRLHDGWRNFSAEHERAGLPVTRLDPFARILEYEMVSQTGINKSTNEAVEFTRRKLKTTWLTEPKMIETFAKTISEKLIESTGEKNDEDHMVD